MSLPAQPSIPSALAMILFNQRSRLLVFSWPTRNLGSLLMSTLAPTKRKGLPLSFPDSHQAISKPPPDAAPKELTVFPFCTQGGWDVNITTQMCKQCNSLTFYYGSQFATGPHSHSVARERERTLKKLKPQSLLLLEKFLSIVFSLFGVNIQSIQSPIPYQCWF